MSSTDPETLLVLEGCEGIEDLEPFLLLVRANLFPELKKKLNSKISDPSWPKRMMILAQVEKGNVTELVVDEVLFPLFMGAVEEINSSTKRSDK